MELARTAVVVIDVQNGLLEGLGGVRQQEAARALDATVGRIAGLLYRARAAGIPVFYIQHDGGSGHRLQPQTQGWEIRAEIAPDRKSTRLNSSHLVISYAVFCLK